MIRAVRVVNEEIDVTIPVTIPSGDVTIKDIAGLGPMKAQINSTARGQSYGSNYSSSQIGNRNLVFSIELYGRDVESTRRRVYLYFPVGERIGMRLYSEDQSFVIYGYVESVVPEIFTQFPTMQVSIICTDPYFQEYPNDNMRVLPTTGQSLAITNKSRVDAGLEVEIKVSPDAVESSGLGGNISFQQLKDGEVVRAFGIEDFDIRSLTQSPVMPGDIIRVNTKPRQKSAILTRNGKNYNIMPAIKDGGGRFLSSAKWPLIPVRQNPAFRYTSNRWILSGLEVTVRWDTLVEGL